MLNYETILSSYDDKMTLMQWLKKVEEALKHASATAFRVNKKGNATISFIIDFEDGTTLESGDIVLQQGESVNGAYIENNHLFITLTNGEVIDAGLMFNGNLTINGIITANIVDGLKVTGDEIVEKMGSGYSIYKAEKENVTHDIVYAGAVKNGNKLTLVLFSKITRTGDVANDFFAPCYFYIPKAIADKIYPTTLGSLQNAVASKQVTLYSAPNVSVTTNGVILKVQQGNLYALQTYIYNLHNLVINTEYQYRIELTFLLSDNLIGN